MEEKYCQLPVAKRTSFWSSVSLPTKQIKWSHHTAVSDRTTVICVHLRLFFHIYILTMTLFLFTYYLSLSSWNAFNVYFKTCIFFLFTYLFTCSYVCRYMWMHISVEARGQPWVSAILFLEAGPLTFTWNLLIQPVQWAPWISLFFFSPQPWDYKSLSPCLVFLWALRMELRTWSSLLAGPAPRSWCQHLLIQLVCNNETFLFVRYCC